MFVNFREGRSTVAPALTSAPRPSVKMGSVIFVLRAINGCHLT